MVLVSKNALKWLASSSKKCAPTFRGLATESTPEEINATGLPLAQRCKVRACIEETN